MTRPINFKKDEVVVLLGAGASVDAGIPHSARMVEEIENALNRDWQEFKELYDYVRSAIFYADGIRGKYHYSVTYNIERLVTALDELLRREEHPLYPFVGAWNPRLTQVAGVDFCKVSVFKTKILEKLRHEWIEIANYDNADYYSGLLKFQRELNYPLRIFTLNYDLCIEKAYYKEYNELPQRGFDKDRFWSHELFEDAVPAEQSIYLYKLHGSIDWFRNSDAKLTYSDSTSKIRVDDGQLIFGTTYKLQYVDPFLFLVYQLRRLSLEAKLLLVIGYGFGDEHINGILGQALNSGQERRLLAVTWCGDQTSKQEEFREFVINQLGADDSRIEVKNIRAKDFIRDELSLDAASRLFPVEQSLFEEVTPSPEVEEAKAGSAISASPGA